MSDPDPVLLAALRVIEEVGFRGATTKRIAEEAGVNEVTLFRRYGSKRQLLMRAMRTAGGLGELATLPDPPSDVRAELEQWCRSHLHALLQARAYIRSSLADTHADPQLCSETHQGPVAFHADLTRYLDAARARGLAAGTWDARVAAALLMGSIFAEAMGCDAMPDRHPYEPDVLSRHFVDLFVTAIGAGGPTQ